MRDKIKYESLIDGTLFLEDVALLNDAIDIHDENQRRLEAAARRAQGHG